MADIKETTEIQTAPAEPKYRERLRGRYADANPQTDQEWDDLTERGFAEDEEKIKLHEDNDKVIQDILDSDKDAAAVISEMIVNGTPFRAAVAKFFDPEDLRVQIDFANRFTGEVHDGHTEFLIGHVYSPFASEVSLTLWSTRSFTTGFLNW